MHTPDNIAKLPMWITCASNERKLMDLLCSCGVPLFPESFRPIATTLMLVQQRMQRRAQQPPEGEGAPARSTFLPVNIWLQSILTPLVPRCAAHSVLACSLLHDSSHCIEGVLVGSPPKRRP